MAMNPCSEMPLERLLVDDPMNEALSSVASHVDRCESCQARLTTLAADAHWWSDAREFLSGDWQPRWQPDLSLSATELSDRSADGQFVEQSVSAMLSPASHPELLGRLGRYDIERVIGSGGMGIVLKAHDSELNRPIAIKVLAAHLAHVGAARQRFAREGRAAAAVVHEHVVAIYNVETDGQMPFLVMQYVPGQSLQARIDAEGPLAVEEILRIGMQAASGLAAAHDQGLVHRDVKPSNILLEESVERAVLTDFGLARAIDDGSLTHTGAVAGTPHYMSPEQAAGEAVDHRSDLFSLGAVLYFMATGRPPFRADGALAVLHRVCHDQHRPTWQTNAQVPDDLSDLIDRLLEKNPKHRPQNAAEVRDRLAAILNRVQQFGIGRRRIRLLSNPRNRRRARRIAVAGLLGLLAVVGTYRLLRPAGSTTGVPPTPAPLDPQVGQRWAALETEYADELQAIETSLERLEQQTFFAQPKAAGWQAELESLQRDVSQLESSP